MQFRGPQKACVRHTTPTRNCRLVYGAHIAAAVTHYAWPLLAIATNTGKRCTFACSVCCCCRRQPQSPPQPGSSPLSAWRRCELSRRCAACVTGSLPGRGAVCPEGPPLLHGGPVPRCRCGGSQPWETTETMGHAVCTVVPHVVYTMVKTAGTASASMLALVSSSVPRNNAGFCCVAVTGGASIYLYISQPVQETVNGIGTAACALTCNCSASLASQVGADRWFLGLGSCSAAAARGAAAAGTETVPC